MFPLFKAIAYLHVHSINLLQGEPFPLDERSNMIRVRYHLVLRRGRIARQIELRLAL